MSDTWAPREGAYGRTRDGQRVGPLRAYDDMGDGYRWSVYYEPNVWWDDRGQAQPGTKFPDLVAEWSDGPVRTVTRREIVPGEYEPVSVRVYDRDPSDHVRVSLFNRDEMYRALNADELDAAAHVLTELAGALRDRG